MKIKDLIFIIKPLSFKDVLEYLVENAQTSNKKIFVVTINPEIIMLSRKDQEYEKVLKSADLALADGIGVVWAAKLFGKSFKGRVPGSDLIEKVCEQVSKQPITVGFLGGKENVAKRTAECLQKKYPGLKVAFALEEWPGAEVARGPVSLYPRPTSSLASQSAGARRGSPALTTPRDLAISHKPLAISRISADILFVAFGPPKQEKWIYENLPKIDVRVAIGIGGAFDFISGRVRRAPLWVRNIGFEWLFRLIIQPWRWRRQLALPKFVILVLRERFF